MEYLPQLALVAVIVGVLIWALQPRYVFVVRVKGETATATRGKVTTGFVQEVAEACREFGVVSGWVGGVRRGKQVALAFSMGIPARCRQRLRNAWALHR
jgi:hypothetical protein